MDPIFLVHVRDELGGVEVFPFTTWTKANTFKQSLPSAFRLESVPVDADLPTRNAFKAAQGNSPVVPHPTAH